MIISAKKLHHRFSTRPDVSTSEFSSGDPGSFPGRTKCLSFNSDTVDLMFNTNQGRDRWPNFCYFCSLKCFNCWWVGGGVEQKFLFRAGCFPGFIQRWRKQGGSKVSFFSFWCLSTGVEIACTFFWDTVWRFKCEKIGWPFQKEKVLYK